MTFSDTFMKKARLGAMVALGALMSCQYFAERHQQAEEAKVTQTATKKAPDFAKEGLTALDTILGFANRKGLTQDMISMRFTSSEGSYYKEGIYIISYKPSERIVSKVISPVLAAWNKGVEGWVFPTDTGLIGYIHRDNKTLYFAETPKGTLTMRFNPDNEYKAEVINQTTGETEEKKIFAPYYHRINEEKEKCESPAFILSYEERSRAVDLNNEWNAGNPDEVNKKVLAKEAAEEETKRKEEFSASIRELKRIKQTERNQARRRYLDLSKKVAAWTYMALLFATGLSALIKKPQQNLQNRGPER